MANQADLQEALTQRGKFEIVRVTVLPSEKMPSQLRILGRSPPARWSFFSLVVNQLLEASDRPGNPWTCDISKQYMRRDGLVRYGWRLIFQAKDLNKQYDSIVSTLLATPAPARVEIDSIMLPGYKAGDVRGGVNAKGKGTSAGGTAPMVLTGRRG